MRPVLGEDEAVRRLIELKGHPFIRSLLKALEPRARLHLVGGSVRDVFLGCAAVDIDLATGLTPDEVEQCLKAAGIRTVDTGKERGTLLAVRENGDEIEKAEITTFRAASGRNTTSFSQSIEEDLAGRDFTINAIAFSLESDVIVDPFQGKRDLEGELLRSVGSAEDRFAEDPLRILRMLRFGPGQGRILDEECRRAAKARGCDITHLSVERVRDELEKMLLVDHPGACFRLARDLELLQYILPELVPCVGFEQNRFHVEDVFEHTLTVLDRSPCDIAIRLASLFHDSGKPFTLSVDEDGDRHFYQHEVRGEAIARSALERLRFGRDLTQVVMMLVRQHMRSFDCGPAGARRLMRDTAPWYEQWRLLKIADMPPSESEEIFAERLRKFDDLVEVERARLEGGLLDKLEINGDDLKDIGFQEGVFLGQCLSALQELILEDPGRNTRENLLQYARKMLETGTLD